MELPPKPTTYFDNYGANSTDFYYFGENSTFDIYVDRSFHECFIDFEDMRVSKAAQAALIFLNLLATFVSMIVLIIFSCVWRTLKTSDLLMFAMTACSFLLCIVFFIHFAVVHALGPSEASAAYCSFISYSYSTLSILVLLLTCSIAIICLLAVARPRAQRRIQHRSFGIKLIAWLLMVALIFAFPFLIFREEHDDPFMSTVCYSHAHYAGKFHALAILKLHSFSFLCTVCLLCMLICYVYIWWRMWRSSKKVGHGGRQSPSARRGILLTVIVLLFMLLSYGPNYLAHVLDIANHHGFISLSCVRLVDLFFVTRYLKVLVQCHAVCNPFLYALLSSSFRSQATEARRRLFGVLCRS